MFFNYSRMEHPELIKNKEFSIKAGPETHGARMGIFEKTSLNLFCKFIKT